jgi:hypothetical protein
VLIYNKNGSVDSIKEIRKGKYVFINNVIAIEKLDNAIYLSKIKK